ncbi:AMP-binding protein [Streptomyces doebereineriae]|uniref:AMP-binding protein n=1 Tax=Streptomyces doebereineriae TaxID=3075528 RepID=UPI00374E1C5B
MRRDSARFDAALADLGIGPGDAVATLKGKSADLVVALHGIRRRGAVHVPPFTAFAPSAVALRLGASGAKAVVVLVGTFNVLRLTAQRITESEPVDGERGVLVATYDGQIGQAAYAAPKGGLDYGRSRGFYTPGRRSLLMEDPSRPGVRMAGRSVPVTRAVAVLEHFQPSGQSYLFAPPLASRGYRRRRTAYDVLELYEEGHPTTHPGKHRPAPGRHRPRTARPRPADLSHPPTGRTAHHSPPRVEDLARDLVAAGSDARHTHAGSHLGPRARGRAQGGRLPGASWPVGWRPGPDLTASFPEIIATAAHLPDATPRRDGRRGHVPQRPLRGGRPGTSVPRRWS